jgi:hypothetical protein
VERGRRARRTPRIRKTRPRPNPPGPARSQVTHPRARSWTRGGGCTRRPSRASSASAPSTSRATSASATQPSPSARPLPARPSLTHIASSAPWQSAARLCRDSAPRREPTSGGSRPRAHAWRRGGATQRPPPSTAKLAPCACTLTPSLRRAGVGGGSAHQVVPGKLVAFKVYIYIHIYIYISSDPRQARRIQGNTLRPRPSPLGPSPSLPVPRAVARSPLPLGARARRPAPHPLTQRTAGRADGIPGAALAAPGAFAARSDTSVRPAPRARGVCV